MEKREITNDVIGFVYKLLGFLLNSLLNITT